MKKICLLLIIPFIFSGYKLELKDKLYTSDSIIYLNDLFKNAQNLPRIPINNYLISNNTLKTGDIINILNKNNLSDYSLIGDNINIIKQNNNFIIHNFPIKDLLTEIQNTMPDTYNLDINNIRTEPEINLDTIENNYYWEIPKLNNGLQDIAKLNKAYFYYNHIKYIIYFNLIINSNIFISKKKLEKNKLLKYADFTQKNMNLMLYNNIDDIVTNFYNLNNYVSQNDINNAKILRWSDIKKTPDVNNGDIIDVVLNKNSINVSLKGRIINASHIGEKVKVKINNKVVKGTLRKKKDRLYVEL